MSKPQSSEARPLPVAAANSAPYWQAAREHRLAFPYCTTCGRWFHPLDAFCQKGHFTSEFRELSGRGTVFTFTTVRDRTTAGFNPPYTVVVATLAEQDDLFLVANLIQSDDRQVSIGMPVEIAYEDVSAECTLPQIRLAEEA